MANCITCEVELKSMNTPLFGHKTSDGDKICTKCSRNLGLKGGTEVMKLTNKIKQFTTAEFLIELRRLIKRTWLKLINAKKEYQPNRKINL